MSWDEEVSAASTSPEVRAHNSLLEPGSNQYIQALHTGMTNLNKAIGAGIQIVGSPWESIWRHVTMGVRTYGPHPEKRRLPSPQTS